MTHSNKSTLQLNIKARYARVLLIFLCLMMLFPYAYADLQEGMAAKGITVDLQSPSYSDGVLTTECGGVITGPDFRIQATHISYARKNEENRLYYTIIAEGDLMMGFGEYLFIGDRLEYDFQSKTGLIYNGRSMAEPWYFGGEQIVLCADGSYIIYNGFVTTSTNACNEWEIASEEASLCQGRYLYAKNVQFRLMKMPILWLPKLQTNLDDIFDAPVRYNVRFWGRQGPRVGITYELFSWNRWKTFLRLDYRLNRGPGGGFETRYHSADRKTNFHMINYVAMDSSLIHPKEKIRYRLQGVFDRQFMDDKVSLNLCWDKLSDKWMATDYKDKGLELDTAGRTQLLIRRQEDRWITNFFSRVRLNSFQSLKQELPTFETTWHPFELGQTNIISDILVRGSYLDFVYGSNLQHVHNYASSRLELAPTFYRNLRWGNLNITPEIGGVTIFYGNSPRREEEKWLALGKVGCEINTALTRVFSHHKHVVKPYIAYNYYTYPSVSPNDHYIFDIEDGWYRLNMVRFGVAQSLYGKIYDGLTERKIFADLYGNAFFDTETIHAIVPKVYANIVIKTHSFLKHTIETAWDFSRNKLDHCNVRMEWTINNNFAISAEYRCRDAYDWRKADHTNFILDSFRSISELRHSLLSDRRDTLLLHFFCRLHPNWAVEFESRQGWNRMFEPKYTEFEIDLLAALRSSINVKLAYQHRENDDRIAVYFNIGSKRPDTDKECNIIPFINF